MSEAADLDRPLPPLREDLRVLDAAPESDGAPAWVIQDPVINRFYRIGWLEFECLLRWGLSARALAAEVARTTPLDAAPDQVLALAGFLEQHQLLRPGPAAVDRLAARSAASPWRQLRWWIHHYLFFRIPLVRPQAVLTRLSHLLAPLFSTATLWMLVALSGSGLVLVYRQWDLFSQAVVDSASPQGLLGFALALIVAKALHEMGHALVATHFGVRVAHMGVAFVVLWPLLYTDTGESWKLPSNRQRLAVSTAGILTELGLAGLATLGWALSEPGAFRNACLYLATTSWTLTLALNLSPFMRFDGYFVLSDLLDFPNLHERSSAIARAALRRVLLGFNEPWPEAFAPRQRRLLIAFALATWVYRALVFLGIALAVYLLFPKLIGILLAAVEVIWFVLAPVWREMKTWGARRGEISTGRRWWFAALAVTVLVPVALPWSSEVRGMGVAQVAQRYVVFAPYPARIALLRPPGPVAEGETLVQLDAPDVDARGERNRARAQALSSHLTGLQARRRGLPETDATGQRLSEQLAEIQAIDDELARLTLRATFTGLWTDVAPERKAGAWIDTRATLGVLIDPARWEADVYVEQADVERLVIGAPAIFYPDVSLEALRGRVLLIDTTRAARIGHAMLATRHGGPIPAAAQAAELVPAEPRYRVRIALESAPASLRETRGELVIEGARRSLLSEWLRALLAVLVRESGF